MTHQKRQLVDEHGQPITFEAAVDGQRVYFVPDAMPAQDMGLEAAHERDVDRQHLQRMGVGGMIGGAIAAGAFGLIAGITASTPSPVSAITGLIALAGAVVMAVGAMLVVDSTPAPRR